MPAKIVAALTAEEWSRAHSLSDENPNGHLLPSRARSTIQQFPSKLQAVKKKNIIFSGMTGIFGVIYFFILLSFIEKPYQPTRTIIGIYFSAFFAGVGLANFFVFRQDKKHLIEERNEAITEIRYHLKRQPPRLQLPDTDIDASMDIGQDVPEDQRPLLANSLGPNVNVEGVLIEMVEVPRNFREQEVTYPSVL